MQGRQTKHGYLHRLTSLRRNQTSSPSPEVRSPTVAFKAPAGPGQSTYHASLMAVRYVAQAELSTPPHTHPWPPQCLPLGHTSKITAIHLELQAATATQTKLQSLSKGLGRFLLIWLSCLIVLGTRQIWHGKSEARHYFSPVLSL